MRNMGQFPGGRCLLPIIAAVLLQACATPPAIWPKDESTAAVAAPSPLAIVASRIDRGEFSQANASIDAALADPGMPADERRAYEFQRERMRRIRLDFGLVRSDAIERVRRRIPDLSEDEFDAWDAQGLLEALDIDGERRWFNRAPDNLFRISEAARARRAPPVAPFPDGPMERLHAHHREVVEASANGTASVAPRRVKIVQSLVVNADAVPSGEDVDAWIPFPRAIAGQQEDIVLLATDPPAYDLAPESALQRTVHLRRQAKAGEATEFSIRYELTVFARRIEIDPARVVPAQPSPGLAPFLAEEAPHIVFTDDVRAFSRRVVGDETHPYRIAQKLFAAVDEIPWAGAREYSTIGNLGDYALRAGHADCGQQTLLLIALLRLNGIPARWQSGWVFSDEADGYSNLHDWGQVYFEPYGWVPMDVTTGLLDSDDERLRWFYLGAQDAYRIAMNDAISVDFVPPKRHFRSETVDSQRGEAEWRGGNLYFDQWDYDFEWQVSKPEAEARP